MNRNINSLCLNKCIEAKKTQKNKDLEQYLMSTVGEYIIILYPQPTTPAS